MNTRNLISVSIAALLASGAACANSDSWQWTADARARMELVDDAAFAESADAATLRLRLGVKWTLDENWSAFAEAESVGGMGDYNSGANGATNFPVVLDPNSTEINQAWLGWTSSAFTARAGRQRLIFDNARFIGNVGWRQNEQTFDALWTQWPVGESFKLQYAYLDRVHRIASDEAIAVFARERDHDSHLLNGSWTLSNGSLTGYSYLLEDRDVASDSSATYGLRWLGKSDAVSWTLEFAQQRDYANSASNFDLDYLNAEFGFSALKLNWKAGLEQLEGDGARGFSTPLATGHAFNGWADRFLNTPANGLSNLYAGVGGSIAKAKWNVVYHQFEAEMGGADYGDEFDASVMYPINDKMSFTVKFADYQSDGFSADSSKLWLQLDWKM